MSPQNSIYLHNTTKSQRAENTEHPQKIWAFPPEKCSQKVLVGEINASIQGVHCLVSVAGDLGLGFLKNMMGEIAVGEDAMGLSSSFVYVLLFYGEPYVKMLWKESQKASHP